jgi:putative inorganic carbon (HCO3(-)) transporter
MVRESLPRRLLKENVVLLLAAMLIVIPLLIPFTRGVAGRAVRNGLLETIGVLLLIVLLARVEYRGSLDQLRYLARSGVNAPLAGLLLWAALGVLWAPDRSFAVGELLRLGTGALIYLAVALHLEGRAQLRLLIDCLLGLGILVIGYGLIVQGGEAARGISSILPNRHHLSAILTVLAPLFASLALGIEERGRRIAAITAAILCGAGLLLSLERSAWIAAAVGLIVGVSLAGRSAAPARSGRPWRARLAVVACGLLVAIGFFAVTDLDAIVARRAGEISLAAEGRDYSFAWRVRKWRGALAMAAERPLLGWGPGQFVLRQSAYTHLGRSPAEVRRYGASFDEMAYNEYLQIAAELGIPGLILYLLLLASFFSKGGRALGRLPNGLRRATLLGCMAGVAAQMVDALANGSWRYTECSSFFWLVLGLGVAVTRMAYQSAPLTVSSPRQSLAVDPATVLRREGSIPQRRPKWTRVAGTREGVIDARQEQAP